VTASVYMIKIQLSISIWKKKKNKMVTWKQFLGGAEEQRGIRRSESHECNHNTTLLPRANSTGAVSEIPHDP
jgi:hypothetical protein